jgi:hypothetical protein
VQRLDTLDQALERRGGDGLWATNRYGSRTAAGTRSATSFGIVSIYHPQTTDDSVLRWGDRLDDPTEERLNGALWRYSERVAPLIEQQPVEFIRQTQSEVLPQPRSKLDR